MKLEKTFHDEIQLFEKTKFFPHHQSDSFDRESVLAVKKCFDLKNLHIKKNKSTAWFQLGSAQLSSENSSSNSSL